MALPRLAGAQTAARRLAGVFPIGFTPVNAQNQVTTTVSLPRCNSAGAAACMAWRGLKSPVDGQR